MFRSGDVDIKIVDTKIVGTKIADTKIKTSDHEPHGTSKMPLKKNAQFLGRKRSSPRLPPDAVASPDTL
jgi:hypothetical protein